MSYLTFLSITFTLFITINSKQCPTRSFIEQSLFDVHIPGAVIIVINTTHTLYQQAFGHQSFLPTQPMNVDKSIFLLASISKTFIALAAMQLVESNLIDLDTDINHYLLSTDPHISHPSFPLSSITLRQLLSHSASIALNDQIEPHFFMSDDDAFTQTTLAQTCFEYLTNNTSNWIPYPPGTVTLYSNVGTGLAALIIERVTRMSFEEYVKENILKPLNINSEEAAFRLSYIKEKENLVRHYVYNSSNLAQWKKMTPRLNITQMKIPNWLSIPWYSLSVYPSGSLRMSGSSLSKYVQMIMNNGSSVIRAESIKEMKKIVNDVISFENVNQTSLPTLQFGLAWNWQTLNNGRRYFGHGGTLPSATNSMLINEKGDIGMIILTNGDIYANTASAINIYQTINTIRLSLFDCFEY
ncbi:hypothetical protein I4U23_012072 [Adineta vaga]|nr:hypothetical protein I4U23_012072 [Adineta vaga]